MSPPLGINALVEDKHVGKRKTSRQEQLLRVINHFRDVTGKTEFEMHEVTDWAVENLDYPLPQPANPREILTRQLSDAARSDIGYDPDNGNPFRRFVAVPQDGQLSFTWMHIHDVSRLIMRKALVHRREQMVGDGLQLTFDRLYWNKLHPEEESIELSMDLSPDIEWRLHTPDNDDEVA